MPHSFIVGEQDAKLRLDLFLNSVFKDVTRSQIKNHIESGKVLVNGVAVKAGFKLKQGTKVEVEDFTEPVSELVPQEIPIEIVFEDEHIIVVNKAQGMVVHPGNGNKDKTLVNALLFCSKLSGGEDFRPGIVHRIDKNTSGLLIVAKTLKAHENLTKQIKERTCKREYVGVCHNPFKELSGTVCENIARHPKNKTKMAVVKAPLGKTATTHFSVLKQSSKYAYVHFVLETGRTHQIRVHLSHIGHPIIGDTVYGSSVVVKGSLGQLLHAFRLTFNHPATNKQLSFSAEPPKYFCDFLELF